MKYIILIAGMLAVVLASQVGAQESTREDFRDFCKAWEGRWVGDVTWVADWPGLGKRGEKVTAYWEGRLTEDGNAMIGKFYGGSGSSTHLIFFDTAARQIKWLWVESGGRVTESRMYKSDDKWMQQCSGSDPHGAKTEFTSTVTITDGGNTHTWTGSGTVDGKKTADQHDVWHRVNK